MVLSNALGDLATFRTTFSSQLFQFGFFKGFFWLRLWHCVGTGRFCPNRNLCNALICKQLNKMLHHLFAFLDALAVLFNGNLLGCSLKPKEIFNIKFCRLLEASPFWILRVNA